MSSVTRRERVKAGIMEAMTDGGYQSATVEKWAWKCDGCGLVWPMKHQAVECEGRGHVSHYQVRYVTGPIVNGVPRYERFYDRNALRKESEG